MFANLEDMVRYVKGRIMIDRARCERSSFIDRDIFNECLQDASDHCCEF